MTGRKQSTGQVLDEVLAATLDAVKVMRNRVRLQDAEGNQIVFGNFQEPGARIQHEAAVQILDRAVPLIQALGELAKTRGADTA